MELSKQQSKFRKIPSRNITRSYSSSPSEENKPKTFQEELDKINHLFGTKIHIEGRKIKIFLD